MTNALNLYFGQIYQTLTSAIIKYLLVLAGVQVGKSFVAKRFPMIQLDRGSQIIIGDNVTFNGEVDLRCRRNSIISLGNSVKLDHGVRIISTNASEVILEAAVRVGLFTVMNCGANLHIGSGTLVAGFCLFQTGAHGLASHVPIREQGHLQDPIRVGTDCWLGTHAVVLGGVQLAQGVVVGANSLVRESVGEDAIVGGTPARIIGFRRPPT